MKKTMKAWALIDTSREKLDIIGTATFNGSRVSNPLCIYLRKKDAEDVRKSFDPPYKVVRVLISTL